MSLRNLIEVLSRGIVLKRKLPKKYGGRSIYVSPEGGLRYWKPYLNNIDPMLLKIVDNYIFSKNIVWDVGANLGYFALSAAHKTGNEGRVLCFEPDIWLCSILKRTIERNSDLKLDIMPMAVSDKIGMANFNIAERSRSTNFLSDAYASTQTGGIRQTYSVPTINLDSVLNYYSAPDFIKIDAEGAEHLVFEGMQKILSDHRPIILCEYAIENYDRIYKTLKKNNYEVYNGENPELLTLAQKGVGQNILAIPN